MNNQMPGGVAGEKPKISAEAIARIWADALERDVGAEDNFFELGGNSMSMMLVLFRIQEEFSVELPPSLLLDSPTPATFARFAQGLTQPKAASDAETL